MQIHHSLNQIVPLLCRKRCITLYSSTVAFRNLSSTNLVSIRHKTFKTKSGVFRLLYRNFSKDILNEGEKIDPKAVKYEDLKPGCTEEDILNSVIEIPTFREAVFDVLGTLVVAGMFTLSALTDWKNENPITEDGVEIERQKAIVLPLCGDFAFKELPPPLS